MEKQREYPYNENILFPPSPSSWIFALLELGDFEL